VFTVENGICLELKLFGLKDTIHRNHMAKPNQITITHQQTSGQQNHNTE
jgi:hypothetical protein